MASAKQDKIKITLTDKDKDVYEFEIDYKNELLLVNCKLEIVDDTLYLKQVDIEGSGSNIFGSGFKKVIGEIAIEFCRKYKTNHIEITGAKRTAGKTKGNYLKTIKHSINKNH